MAKKAAVEDDLIDETTKKLNHILSSLQKQFGNEAVMLPSKGSGSNVKWVLTDSPNINDLIGYGFPQGRMVEIFGPESSGKTSFAEFIVGTYQKAGQIAAYIDLENALDHQYAATFGMDVNKTLLVQPDSAEEAMNILKAMIIEGVGLIVVDSTDALVPLAEQEADFEDQQMALRARLLSRTCRVVTPLMRKSGTTIIWISQVRADIGSMSKDKVKSSISNAVKFYCSVRIKCTAADPIMGRGGADDQIGMCSRLKTVKNKLVAPNRIRVVKIHFGKGYQTDDEWIEYATLHDVIKKTSSGWFTLPSGERVNGLAKLVLTVGQDPVLKAEVITETRKRMQAVLDSPKIIDQSLLETATRVVDEEDAPIEEDPEVAASIARGIDQIAKSAVAMEIIKSISPDQYKTPDGKILTSWNELIDLLTDDDDLLNSITKLLSTPVEIDEDLSGLESVHPISDEEAAT
jgi:recombination protein RecA